MSSLAYAPFNSDENDNVSMSGEILGKKNNNNKNKNKTLKKKPNTKRKVQNMIESIHKSNDDDDDVSDMANFAPPKPESAANERIDSRSGNNLTDDNQLETTENDESQTPEIIQTDEAFTAASFKEIQPNKIDDYYRINVPYYSKLNNQQDSSKDELMKKLEKILFLLEEQQDHKTGHVTEELILYSFVGVFIIFVVDSFARAGKYVR